MAVLRGEGRGPGTALRTSLLVPISHTWGRGAKGIQTLLTQSQPRWPRAWVGSELPAEGWPVLELCGAVTSLGVAPTAPGGRGQRAGLGGRWGLAGGRLCAVERRRL